MTKEDRRTQEAPQKRGGAYAGGALLITITIFISVFFTGGIVYGIQSLVGGRAKPVEGVLVDGVRKFKMSAQQWNFAPAVIKVNPGDAVEFIVGSRDIRHGFAINELGVNLALSPTGVVKSKVVIPPDITGGTYTMYCSIFCGIGHPYMKGSVIVGTPVPFLGVGIEKILPWGATGVLGGLFAAFIISGRRKQHETVNPEI